MGDFGASRAMSGGDTSSNGVKPESPAAAAAGRQNTRYRT